MTLTPPHSHLSRFRSENLYWNCDGEAHGDNLFAANHTAMHVERARHLHRQIHGSLSRPNLFCLRFTGHS